MRNSNPLFSTELRRALTATHSPPHRLVDARQAELADAALSRLCAELRPDVIAVVDAFDIPDRVLNSTLGRFDGKPVGSKSVALRP